MLKWLSKVVLALLICVGQAWGQSEVSDVELIANQDFHDYVYDKHRVQYVFKDLKNPILKYNPVSLVFGGLLFFYQKTISVQLSTKCSFEVSCSNFSKLAIKRYGLLKGVALSADRLSRCTYIASFDLEPLDVDSKAQKIKDPIEQYRLKH